MNTFEHGPGWRGAAALILMLAAALFAQGAGAEPVAMATDVQGKAVLAAAGAKRDLAILAEIDAGTQVELAQGTRLVVVYLRSGEEYTATGPALIRFDDSAPQSISGAQPQRRASALEKGKGIRIRPVGVAQAAIVMRSAKPAARIKLLTLAGSRTLEPSPEFRWQALEGARGYHFNLADATGRSVLEFDVAGESYRLPASVRLEEGVTYTWDLSTRLPDGRRYASAGDFSIVPAGQREEVEALRPAANAPLAERIAFAAWLEQQDLHDEARKYWKAAAAERPQDARLKQLAGD